jgi:hypothetical protein
MSSLVVDFSFVGSGCARVSDGIIFGKSTIYCITFFFLSRFFYLAAAAAAAPAGVGSSTDATSVPADMGAGF